MSPTHRAFARPLTLALIAAFAVAILPAAAARTTRASTQDPATVWINELHYDNDGVDADEFIEIAGPAGEDLTGWAIVLYNGANGLQYPIGTVSELSGTIPDHQNGFGVVSVLYPTDGVQNGSPDGIALVDGSTVVQFLSYEGTFSAVNGVASGVLSTDIGVSEPNTTPTGSSLQLVGTGTVYQDFTWAAPAPNSRGAVNTGQTFGEVEDEPTTMTCVGAIVASQGGATVTRQISATDADDTVVDIALDSVVPPNAGITLGATDPADEDGGTATATLSIGTATAGSFVVTLEATNDDATNPQSATCTINVTVNAVLHIGQIQGSVSDTADGLTHRSPLAPPTGNGSSAQLFDTRGVVTQRVLSRSSAGAIQHGFFLQERPDATDGNPTTSDGIFVFMGTFTSLIGGYVPTVGDEIVIRGRVSEFFFLTQLTGASLVSLEDSGVDIPAFEVDPPAVLAAANRYWERGEGMQAQLPAGSIVQGGRSVFPSTADGEIYFYRDDYEPLADRDDPYARRIFRDPHPLDDLPEPLFDNGNGFRFLIGSFGVKWTSGDSFTLVTPADTHDVLTNSPAGGIYFGFNKYQIQVAQQPTFIDGVDPAANGAPEAPDPAFDWTSATYNVENLYDFRDDPTDGCDFLGNTGCPGVAPPFDFVPGSAQEYDEQLTTLATQIIEDLHAPDLILTQEAEDQDICHVDATGEALACGGAPAGDGLPDTMQDLALRIAFLGGPTYAPALDRDGADDRGIVSGFLYRTDRVELLPVAADDPVLTADTGVVYDADALGYNEDVENPKALNAELPDDLQGGSTLDGNNVFTRPPQVGHFRVWRDGVGTSVFFDLWAMSNHFSSTPDGRVFQRIEQSTYLAAIADAIQASDPDAWIIAGGDFNVFPRPDDPFAPGQPIGTSGLVGPSDQLGPLYLQGLVSLWESLADEIPAAAYSYVFQGQAQTLDSQFISPALETEFEAYRVAHINADYAQEEPGDGTRGASDHDPSQARYDFEVTIARLDALVRYLDANGEIRGNNTTRNLLDRLAKITEYQADGKTAAVQAQLVAFIDQVGDFSPQFIDADVATGLQEEAGVLLGS